MKYNFKSNNAISSATTTQTHCVMASDNDERGLYIPYPPQRISYTKPTPQTRTTWDSN